MLNLDEPDKAGYKLHCCDILLSEINNDLRAARELIAYRRLLIADQLDIKKNAIKGRVFLAGNYW
jgi:hypothetical protein